MPTDQLFADILLPLAVPFYTFAVPEELRSDICRGCLVAVPLGARKIYTGIVWRLHSEAPSGRVRPVIKRLHGMMTIPDTQMKFWEWIADYYMCTAGDVMRTALPSRLRAEGFSADEFEADLFRIRAEQRVWLNPAIGSREELETMLAAMPRAGKQRAAVQAFADRAGDNLSEYSEPKAQTGLSAMQLARLQQRGILSVRTVELRRTAELHFSLPALSAAQQEALGQLRSGLQTKDTVLLHGVMSSGKTEVFLSYAAEVIASGADVLVLLPEISVTAQFAERLCRILGRGVTVYHSKLTDRARAEIYMDMARADSPRVVLGARSALFLPFRRLGLVIVDEEHEASFKQQDPAPRYNARDAAQMLCRISGAKTILSSATPSLESYSNALSGRYSLVRLSERYGHSPSPQIVISDTLRSARRGERRSHFNGELLRAAADAVANGRQVLLFQNRRGVAPYVECTECGSSVRCGQCGIAMTLHSDSMRCHYCGRTEPVPPRCPSCGRESLQPCGFGTEKVEQSLSALIPSARVARLDRDTATSPAAYARTVSDFEHRRTDILVGTQIIAKGFDFEHLDVVGVLNADNMLNYPDFRASERAFATLTQIAGRPGRRHRQGTVVIQTAQKDNPVIRQVAAGDYDSFARQALAERSAFDYPPYCRLIEISVRHRDRHTCRLAAEETARRIGSAAVAGVLGPQAPAVEFLAGRYVQSLMVKIPRSVSHASVRGMIAAVIDAVRSRAEFRAVSIVPDVDPQ